MKDTFKIWNVCCVALLSLVLASCMDEDWKAPDFGEKAPYGNNDIDSTNIITIDSLFRLYPAYAENYTCTEMDKDAKLRVWVTGNDIQGNLYNSIAVEDDHGNPLIIAISENSLFGYLPVGQELIIDTKGLYIGGYGQQPQLGMPYTNAKGNTYVSRMSSSTWQKHVKLTPYIMTEMKPLDFYPNMDISYYCGKLMTIKNVEIQGADGKMKWAPEKEASNNAVSRYLVGSEYRNIEIYTSAYADFANAIVPQGKVNLTGIWKRYNNTWEIILRSEADVEVVK